MCLIIDACSANLIATPNNEASSVILDWVRTKGRVVSGGLLQEELIRTKLRNIILAWSAAGKFKIVDKIELDAEISSIEKLDIRSNDLHVIALARIADAGVVVTGDDLLIQDIKDSKVSKRKRKVIKFHDGYQPRLNIVRNVLRSAGCA